MSAWPDKTEYVVVIHSTDGEPVCRVQLEVPDTPLSRSHSHRKLFVTEVAADAVRLLYLNGRVLSPAKRYVTSVFESVTEEDHRQLGRLSEAESASVIAKAIEHVARWYYSFVPHAVTGTHRGKREIRRIIWGGWMDRCPHRDNEAVQVWIETRDEKRHAVLYQVVEGSPARTGKHFVCYMETFVKWLDRSSDTFREELLEHAKLHAYSAQG